VVTVNTGLLHSRPPDPVEPDRSIVRSAHDPTCAGANIKTDGEILMAGEETVVDISVLVNHSSHFSHVENSVA